VPKRRILIGPMRHMLLSNHLVDSRTSSSCAWCSVVNQPGVGSYMSRCPARVYPAPIHDQFADAAYSAAAFCCGDAF
jgi:hypothetical protein